MPHELGISDTRVPMSDWLKFSYSERSWSSSATGVYASARRLHALRTQLPRDQGATIVTTRAGIRAQLLGYQQANRNINGAATLLGIFSSSLKTIEGTLGSMRTLATDASNVTMTDSERSLLDVEYGELGALLDETAKLSEYSNIKLLSGAPSSLRFQVSIRGEGTHQILMGLPDLTLQGLFSGGTNILTLTDASNALPGITSGEDRTQTSLREAAAVVQGLAGATSFTGRVITFMMEKLETIKDAPMDRDDVRSVISELLADAEKAILAQDPEKLGEAKGDVQIHDLLEETTLPLDLDLFSLNANLAIAARNEKPFLNINDATVTPGLKAPFVNLPT